MRRFEREVVEPYLIEAMLTLFETCYLGLNDESFPYVVPVNFGFEMDKDYLYIYIHCAKKGHKVELIKKDPHVSVTMSLFHDFPDIKYKGHLHDYRSIMAKGIIQLVTSESDYDTFKRGYDLLYTCNNREIVPLESRKVIPPIYIGVIKCDMKDVTAKSEFPIRTVKDVPFLDPHNVPYDETPFNISDIIEKRKPKK